MSVNGSTPLSGSQNPSYGTLISPVTASSSRQYVSCPTPPPPEEPPPSKPRSYKVINAIMLAASASIFPAGGAALYESGGTLYKGLAIAIWFVSLAILLLGVRNILKYRNDEQPRHPSPA